MTELSEAALQAAVIDLARWAGFLHFHVHDSRKSAGAGFPDLVLLHQRTGRLLFVELKSSKGRLRPAQTVWLTRLALRHETHIWRPDDWHSGAIRAALTTERQEAA